MEKGQNESNKYQLLKNDFFIKRISGKFIISSVISTLFVFAGSLIDTMLIGLFVGEAGLSAMSLVSPVYLVYYTVGATVGIGASILSSRVLGKGDIDKYKKIFSCSTLVLATAAVIMTVLAYVFINPITSLLCGSVIGESREMVKDYLLFYIPGGAFTLISYIPLYFLKTDGKPKLSSRLFTLSAVINVVLSCLFMSPLFSMKVAGASLATSIAMGTVAVLGFILMLMSRTELKFVKKSFSLGLLKQMLVTGIPNGMNNLLSSARILLINMLFISLGASALLPCYTVVRNVSDVLGSIIIGISSAVIPLIGVFYGERDYEGNRSIIKLAKKAGVIVIIPLIIVTALIPDLLFYVFGVTDTALIAEGRWALPLATVGLVCAYFNTLYIGHLTATKREAIAAAIVALRLLVVLAACAFPLSKVLGTKGIWLSFSLSEAITLLLFYVFRKLVTKKNKNLDMLLLDRAKEHEGNITFSVRNNVEDIVFATEQISSFCDDNGIDMRRAMKVSLAIEELLTFLNAHCLSSEEDSYTDVRVCKLENEVMVRFRYVGKIYDPVSFYRENEFNEDMQEELLGLKMITKSASLVNFSQTLGANNLVFIF